MTRNRRGLGAPQAHHTTITGNHRHSEGRNLLTAFQGYLEVSKIYRMLTADMMKTIPIQKNEK